MWIKAQHDRSPARGLRIVAGLANHALVTEVNTVKHTNRQAHLVGMLCEFFKCTEHLHYAASAPISFRIGMINAFNSSRVCFTIVSSEWASFTSNLPDF